MEWREDDEDSADRDEKQICPPLHIPLVHLLIKNKLGNEQSQPMDEGCEKLCRVGGSPAFMDICRQFDCARTEFFLFCRMNAAAAVEKNHLRNGNLVVKNIRINSSAYGI